jgi:hypothetical protein
MARSSQKRSTKVAPHPSGGLLGLTIPQVPRQHPQRCHQDPLCLLLPHRPPAPALPDGPGFHGVTLSLADHAATAELLTALLGYEAAGKEGNTYRYAIPTTCPARFVDVVKLPGGEPALQGGGSVHHVAYSVPDRAAQGDVKQLSFGSRVAEEEIDDPQGYFVERHDLLTQW